MSAVRDCYVFAEEPSGPAYGELVDFCCMVASTMLLVVRDPQLDPGESIQATLDQLSPFLAGKRLTGEWPGTVLLGDEANEYRYRVNDHLRRLLRNRCDRLFGWLHPDTPEDPCFFRAEDDVVLVTTSHEKEPRLSCAG